MWMNWEQTDRVRAETANDSSSKAPWATASGFLLGGRRVEFLFWQAQVGRKLEVKDDANKSLGAGLQVSTSHQEGSRGAIPATRSHSSLRGRRGTVGGTLLPPKVRRCQKHEVAEG